MLKKTEDARFDYPLINSFIVMSDKNNRTISLTANAGEEKNAWAIKLNLPI